MFKDLTRQIFACTKLHLQHLRAEDSPGHRDDHERTIDVERHEHHGICREDLLDDVEHAIEHDLALQRRTYRLRYSEDRLKVVRAGPRLVE
jgi:hypothetical protein